LPDYARGRSAYRRDRRTLKVTRGGAVPYAKANGIGLYYELKGSGEPVVLVHGSWGDATSWRFVVTGLAERFRVLAYDRRGHS
jgi:pimeloyl-ACP methyl ester carboxylesterase